MSSDDNHSVPEDYDEILEQINEEYCEVMNRATAADCLPAHSADLGLDLGRVLEEQRLLAQLEGINFILPHEEEVPSPASVTPPNATSEARLQIDQEWETYVERAMHGCPTLEEPSPLLVRGGPLIPESLFPPSPHTSSDQTSPPGAIPTELPPYESLLASCAGTSQLLVKTGLPSITPLVAPDVSPPACLLAGTDGTSLMLEGLPSTTSLLAQDPSIVVASLAAEPAAESFQGASDGNGPVESIDVIPAAEVSQSLLPTGDIREAGNAASDDTADMKIESQKVVSTSGVPDKSSESEEDGFRVVSQDEPVTGNKSGSGEESIETPHEIGLSTDLIMSGEGEGSNNLSQLNQDGLETFNKSSSGEESIETPHKIGLSTALAMSKEGKGSNSLPELNQDGLDTFNKSSSGEESIKISNEIGLSTDLSTSEEGEGSNNLPEMNHDGPESLNKSSSGEEELGTPYENEATAEVGGEVSVAVTREESRDSETCSKEKSLSSESTEQEKIPQGESGGMNYKEQSTEQALRPPALSQGEIKEVSWQLQSVSEGACTAGSAEQVGSMQLESASEATLPTESASTAAVLTQSSVDSQAVLPPKYGGATEQQGALETPVSQLEVGDDSAMLPLESASGAGHPEHKSSPQASQVSESGSTHFASEGTAGWVDEDGMDHVDGQEYDDCDPYLSPPLITTSQNRMSPTRSDKSVSLGLLQFTDTPHDQALRHVAEMLLPSEPLFGVAPGAASSPQQGEGLEACVPLEEATVPAASAATFHLMVDQASQTEISFAAVPCRTMATQTELQAEPVKRRATSPAMSRAPSPKRMATRRSSNSPRSSTLGQAIPEGETCSQPYTRQMRRQGLSRNTKIKPLLKGKWAGM